MDWHGERGDGGKPSSLQPYFVHDKGRYHALRDKRDYHVPGAMPSDRGNRSKNFGRVMRQRYQHRGDKRLTFHQSERVSEVCKFRFIWICSARMVCVI